MGSPFWSKKAVFILLMVTWERVLSQGASLLWLSKGC